MLHRNLAPIVALAGLLAAPGALAQSDPYGSPSSLNTGGLAPPGSGNDSQSAYDPHHQSYDTEQSLKAADESDSGRGLQFVWLNAEAGFQFLSLNTFHANNLVDSQYVKSSQSGPIYGLGAGLQLVFLTLGARFRLGNFSSWQMWTLDAEAGIRVPIGRVEPYVILDAGYASLGDFGGANSALNLQSTNIHGYNARLGFGMDFYITKAISIGALMTGDVLYLKRSKVSQLPVDPALQADPAYAKAAQIYANDGSSVGGAATLTAVLGLHF